jgi:hypothetical protein
MIWQNTLLMIYFYFCCFGFTNLGYLCVSHCLPFNAFEVTQCPFMNYPTNCEVIYIFVCVCIYIYIYEVPSICFFFPLFLRWLVLNVLLLGLGLFYNRFRVFFPMIPAGYHKKKLI